jgi:hypothetical protein
LLGSLSTELLVACQAIRQHLTYSGTQLLGITRAGSRLEFTGMLLSLMRQMLKGLELLWILVCAHKVFTAVSGRVGIKLALHCACRLLFSRRQLSEGPENW